MRRLWPALLALVLVVLVLGNAQTVSAVPLPGTSAKAFVKAADDDIPGVPLPSSPVTGTLDVVSDPWTCYSLYLEEGEVFNISLTGDEDTDFDAYLFGPGATSVDDYSWLVEVAINPDYPDTFSYAAGSSGTYYLCLNAWSGFGSYTLTYTISAPVGDDDIPGSPLPSHPFTGALGEDDPRDVFCVYIQDRAVLDATLVGDADTRFDLHLFGPGSTSVGVDQDVASATKRKYPKVLSYTVPSGEGGIYYLCVEAMSGSGAYSLTSSVSPELPPAPPVSPRCAVILGGTTELGGSYNDAVDMRDILIDDCGYDPDCILLLSGPQLTKRNVQTAICEWLDDCEKASSQVVIFFSGHGTNVPDGPPYDEADGRDEAICTNDGGVVTDDELESWTRSLESRQVVIIVDSCFSGGMARTHKGNMGKSSLPGDGFSGHLIDGFGKDLIGKSGRIIMTACAEDELSAETYVLHNGIYTWHLMRALTSCDSDIDSDGRVSAEEAHARVVSEAGDWGYTPQMHDKVPVPAEVELSYLGEPPAEEDDAIPGVVLPAFQVAGTLDVASDPWDCYMVDLHYGDVLDVSLTGDPGTDFDVLVAAPSSINLSHADWVAETSSTAYPEALSYVAEVSGVHHLCVRAYGGGGAYTLSYAITAADDDIPGWPLPLYTSPVTGTLNEADQDDLFSVDLVGGTTFEVTLTGDAGTDFALFLFAPGSTSIFIDPYLVSSTGSGYPVVLSYAVPAGVWWETHYLDVRALSGSGAYALTYIDSIPIEALPPSPVTGTLDAMSAPWACYSVHLDTGQTLDVSLSGELGTDFDALLADPYMRSLYDSSCFCAMAVGTDYPDTFSYTAWLSGTYRLYLNAFDGSGSYELIYSID